MMHLALLAKNACFTRRVAEKSSKKDDTYFTGRVTGHERPSWYSVESLGNYYMHKVTSYANSERVVKHSAFAALVYLISFLIFTGLKKVFVPTKEKEDTTGIERVVANTDRETKLIGVKVDQLVGLKAADNLWIGVTMLLVAVMALVSSRGSGGAA